MTTTTIPPASHAALRAEPATGRPVLALEPRLLAGVARELTATAITVLEQPPPPPPDTGASTATTLAHLERLVTRTDGLAGDVQAVAGVLDRVVRLLRDADDAVADAFDRVRAESRR